MIEGFHNICGTSTIGGPGCVGRDSLADAVISSAMLSKSVLLFGGRQAGKTTLLKFMAQRSVENADQINEFTPINVAVYVDLLALPYDAGPAEFYRLLLRTSADACSRHVRQLETSAETQFQHRIASHELFAEGLNTIARRAGERPVRFIFLLDEAKRVVGNRFPRGFQDNLFSLLYGGAAELNNNLAIIFCGAQDLYSLSEDDTSPIGSRAAVQIITNLARQDLTAFLNSEIAFTAEQRQEFADALFTETGGHAGLSARLAAQLAPNVRGSTDYETACAALRSQYIPLFRHWNRRFTREARALADVLTNNPGVSLQETASALEEAGYDRFVADRVWEELQYTGIANRRGSIVEKANRAYWTYVKDFATDEPFRDTRSEWALLEETEVALRQFVALKFSKQWPTDSEVVMQQILGEDWAKLEDIRARSNKYYPYAKEKRERDILECMYLGQLGNLMLSSRSWALFQPLFRDKRHLQDLLAAISAVRNDRAHFVSVPDKELQRCRIACDDLLVIMEKALNNI